MFLRLLLVVVVLGWGFPAWADEDSDYHIYEDSHLFVGELVKTTLFPRDRSKPAEICTPAAEGDEEDCYIIVSNGCGHEIIQMRVFKGIIGAKTGDVLNLKTSIGEWCQYNLSLHGGKKVIFALKREEREGVFENEYTIFEYKLHTNEEGRELFFLEIPYKFNYCGKLTNLNCYSLLKPADPEYVGTTDRDLDWVRDFEKKGLMTRGDEGQMYMLKAIFLDDLIAALK